MRPLTYLRRPFQLSIANYPNRRNLLTLAIETSCDDTSVAILEKHEDSSATLHFNSKITSDNRVYGGVHPIAAHESHQQNIAKLVNDALRSLPHKATLPPDSANVVLVKGPHGPELRQKPDFITVTRGPGMRASLFTGVDTAKGLAVAWQIPFLGVNHMQAHALTPRLVSALDSTAPATRQNQTIHADVLISDHGHHKKLRSTAAVEAAPAFPFLSLLVSGGHTMLVHSKDLCDHEILAETTDIAIGTLLDKCAREVLPYDVLNSSSSVMYGSTLERFAFPDMDSPAFDYGYTPPAVKGKKSTTSSVGSNKKPLQYEWSISRPLLSPGPGVTPEEFAAKLCFSGIGSTVRSIMAKNPGMEDAERRDLAREAMRIAFEHVGSRLLIALENLVHRGVSIETLVVSGGVACNQYLKHILRTLLDSKGYNTIRLVFPPPKFCTDNAAMIAWTGIEMWEAGYSTEFSAMAIRQWAIDPKASDGGILGVDGWFRYKL